MVIKWDGESDAEAAARIAEAHGHRRDLEAELREARERCKRIWNSHDSLEWEAYSFSCRNSCRNRTLFSRSTSARLPPGVSDLNVVSVFRRWGRACLQGPSLQFSQERSFRILHGRSPLLAFLENSGQLRSLWRDARPAIKGLRPPEQCSTQGSPICT